MVSLCCRHRNYGRIFGALSVLLVGMLLLSGCGVRIGEGDREWNDFVEPFRGDANMMRFKMHYIDIGQGKPVVMIHGYSDSTYCWHENVRMLLSTGFRVILMDQPGLGRSSRPQGDYVYSIENQSEEILALLDKLEIERFSVVGNSMGGGIALYLSLHHPDRVTSTVVISPACYQPQSPGLGRFLTIPGATHLAGLLVGRWAVRHDLQSVYFDDEQVDEVLVDEYCRAFQKPGFMKTVASLSEEYFSAAFHEMTESYHELDPPLLIIWGEHDRWVPPDFGQRLQEKVPGSRYELIGECGHVPHQEKPGVVNSLLLEFFLSKTYGIGSAPSSS